MKLVSGFALLGFLVGDMAGLTAESVVSKIIALLFALFGGSVIVLYSKFTDEERGQVGSLITAISLGTLLGVHLGILTTQYRWLSPKPVPAVVATASPVTTTTDTKVANMPVAVTKAEPPKVVPPKTPDDSPYLRKDVESSALLIDERLDHHSITVDQAYQQLRDLLTREKH